MVDVQLTDRHDLAGGNKDSAKAVCKRCFVGFRAASAKPSIEQSAQREQIDNFAPALVMQAACDTGIFISREHLVLPHLDICCPRMRVSTLRGPLFLGTPFGRPGAVFLKRATST